MLLRLLFAAAEEARHHVVPPAERAIGGSLKPAGIDREDALQLISDPAPVFQSLAHAERFGERAHVGGHPEMSFGRVRLQFDRLLTGRDAALERRAATRLLVVRADPVAGTAELPRGFEILTALRARAPDVRRLAGERHVLALSIQLVGVG